MWLLIITDTYDTKQAFNIITYSTTTCVISSGHTDYMINTIIIIINNMVNRHVWLVVGVQNIWIIYCLFGLEI